MNTVTKRTVTFSGRGIGRGSAVGKLNFYRRADRQASAAMRRSRGAAEETEQLRTAIRQASDQLDELYSRTLRDAGEEEAKIFEIHRMLLDDEDFFETAQSLILDGFSAAYSVSEAAERYSSVLASIDDEYLSARAADLRDVASRVAGILSGEQQKNGVGELDGDEKYIIAADDLTPSETVQLDREKILGFVTFAGSPNSHTAILARALGIPALIGTGEMDGEYHGRQAIIDADSGLLYVDPDDELLARYAKIEKAAKDGERALQHLRGKKSRTKGGREIHVYANIGSSDEAATALKHDAEGIGLLRSEFLYLKQDHCPDENQLFTAYRDTVTTMKGRQVIIRTLDIGADKKVAYFDQADEENPAMGLRGVRLTLSRRDLFRTQLRAICRASAYGKVSVMIPMVALPDEVAECRKLLREVQNELAREGVKFDPSMQFGIMIETPSAVIMSRELAGMVDFFSVGTNDLAQYALAADRQNHAVAELCDRGREPVLRMIALAAKSAHEAGIWIGICGELAADLTLTQRLIDIGVDELSVSPPYVLPLRGKIIECN
ncbi:MAG: phosphoenolpyruvate--protein phosphotransferase [Clostridia bacterium]|nr:phosphoenolpyruvate--protein phosphotransferase [Clostridia bacterium]